MNFLVLVAMVSCTYGLMTAWSSPFIVKITQDKVNYNISEDQAAYFTLIPPITMVTFCPFFSKMNDIFGRKTSLQMMIIPYIISLILTAVAENVYVFYASRFFAGLGDACHFASVPMYIGEITTPSVRGTWGNTISVFIFLGQFLINLIGQQFSVWVSAYICLPLPIAFLILSLYLPESPFYCVMKGNEEGAKHSLRILRGDKSLDQDFHNLKLDVDRQMSERGRWLDLFVIGSNRRAFIGGLFLRISQQFSAITVFNVYVQFIFEKSGTKIDAKMSALVVTFVLFFITLIAAFTVENFGRRKTYMCSLLACALCLLANGVYFILDQFTNTNLSTVNWLPLVFSVVYIIFCAFGIGMLPTLMLGEIFSASIKAYGLSFLSLALGALQFITNAIFYFLNTKLGLYAPFIFFGLCTMLSSIVSLHLVPETKGKTLEEIQQDLKKKELKTKSKPIDVIE